MPAIKHDESYTWQVEKFSRYKFEYVESRNGYDRYSFGSSIFGLSVVQNGRLNKLNLQLSLSQRRRCLPSWPWLGLTLHEYNSPPSAWSNETAEISDPKNTCIAWIAGKKDEYTCKLLGRVSKDHFVFHNSKFVLFDDLFDKSKDLLHNGQLTIVCEVRTTHDVPGVRPLRLLADHEGNTLASDLRKIREEGKNTDFTVVARDGREFPVHTLILSSRSAYFDTMFKQDMREKHEKRVIMDDISSEAVAGLLDFIYTDAVPNINSMAPELLLAAHKYNIPRLMLLCEDTMVSNLNVDNAAQLYHIADMYDATHFLSAVKQFIIKNLKEVKATDGWKQFVYHSARLADKLFDDVADFVAQHKSP